MRFNTGWNKIKQSKKHSYTRQEMHENPSLVLNTDDLKTLLRDDAQIKSKAKSLRWEWREDHLKSSPFSLLLSHIISSYLSRPQAMKEGEVIDLQYNNEEDRASQL
jgi:hypothetical protein